MSKFAYKVYNSRFTIFEFSYISEEPRQLTLTNSASLFVSQPITDDRKGKKFLDSANTPRVILASFVGSILVTMKNDDASEKLITKKATITVLVECRRGIHINVHIVRRGFGKTDYNWISGSDDFSIGFVQLRNCWKAFAKADVKRLD